MTVIVFLFDNSASMAQKSYMGITYLDFARQFVDLFLKLRQRDPTSKADRYMLMGYDEYPKNVKSGWKESQGQFNEQLRNLRPTGCAQFAESFFNAIRFVNLNRVQTGIENYGYGRYPSYSEPVIFIAIVDASSDSPRPSFLHNDLFPRLPASGADMTEEPWRWDHKLFVVFLNLPGHTPLRLTKPSPASNERNQIERIVERINGRSYEVSTHRALNATIENILQRVQQTGVYIRFIRDETAQQPTARENGNHNNAATNTPTADGAAAAATAIIEESWPACTTLITRVLKAPPPAPHATWPIPESFWPDQLATTIPPRKVYPEIYVRCVRGEPVTRESLTVDKYEVESCALTQALVSKQNTGEVWTVFVRSSHKHPGIGYPFGYLKLAANLRTVNLCVFPYNYPLLYALLQESQDEKLRKSAKFKQKLDRYMANLPAYYVQPLRKALASNKALQHPRLDERTASVPYNAMLIEQFKKWREHGREDFETTCQAVANSLNPQHADCLKAFPVVCGVQQLPMVPVTSHLNQASLNSAPIRVGLSRNYAPTPPLYKNARIAVSTTRVIKKPSSKFRNPYEIERVELLDQLEKMRVNLDLQFATTSIAALEGGLPGQRLHLQHAEDLHCLPVGKMGDYQKYQMRLAEIGMAPLRELEPEAPRPHAFGNPFKMDKRSMAVDEVGEFVGAAAASPTPAAKQKRTTRINAFKARVS